MKKKLSLFLAAIIMLTVLAPAANAATPNDKTTAFTDNYQYEDIYDIFATELLSQDEIFELFGYAGNIDDYATRGYCVEQITKGLSAHDITLVQGYGDGGGLRLNQPVSRVEVLTMLARALPRVPDSSIRLAFQDLPEWAAADVGKLASIEIVRGYSPTLLGAYDNITVRQLFTFILRSQPYATVMPQDDFYQAVNSNWLNVYAPDEIFWTDSSFEDAQYIVSSRIETVLDEMLTSSLRNIKGTNEQRVADYYEGFLDWNKRNAMGITPLAPYLNAIDSAKSLEELFDTTARIHLETGTDVIVRFDYTYIGKDLTPLSIFGGFATHLNESDYLDDNTVSRLEEYLIVLFKEMGMSNTEATNAAKVSIEVGKELSKYESNVNSDYIGTPMSLESFAALFPNVDMVDYFESIDGLFSDEIAVLSPENAEYAGEYLREENLAKLKIFTKSLLVSAFGYSANETIYNAHSSFYLDIAPEDMAYEVLFRDLSVTIEQRYIKNYFSVEQKNDVTRVVNSIVAVYRERLQNSTWLSADARAEAIRKLDNIEYFIGYPEKWFDRSAAANIAGMGFLADEMAVSSAILAAEKEMAHSGNFDNDTLCSTMIPTYTVNAFYVPEMNVALIPAAILTPPLYSPEFSAEAIFSRIGFIIAHEISHAFDPEGSKYDADGNERVWWSDKDAATYAQMCENLRLQMHNNVANYNAVMNGGLVLNEAVADLGAMSCVLEALAKYKSNPNYNIFFQSYAMLWRSISPPELQEYYALNDEHPADRFRVNTTLQNMDIFQRTYNVIDGNGMYLAPRDRVIIW